MKRTAATISLMFATLYSVNAGAAPPVTLELVTESGFSITGAQEWNRTLNNVGATSVRIRKARRGDYPKVTNRGTEASPSYQVIGVLTSQGTLRLPTKTFRQGDRAGISAWIARLRGDGIAELAAPKGAFGLSANKMLGLHKLLSAPVITNTKGKKVSAIVASITDVTGVDVQLDATARAALQGDETVLEELQGLSSGTALAAIIRPLGLVVAPQRSVGQATRLQIVDARAVTETWPVGWPPEKSPGDTMPKLLEFLDVEIDDFALQDALDAIEKRLDVPFIYDQNSMARHGIEPKSIKVSLPKGRTYYKKIVDRLLYQGEMKAELRVDEAGKPFLWLTTLKK